MISGLSSKFFLGGALVFRLLLLDADADDVMTPSFRRFVYQVVVPKALAPKELVKIFEGEERSVLPPWDPMVCFFSRSFLIFGVGLKTYMILV